MFAFGVDYYPEQWPEARWAEDARLMKQAGFNVVRLAEFAWSRLEPQQGQFDFDWLDRAIELLAGSGMRIVLGTPTASPPPWLMSRREDLFRVLRDGRRVTYGHRRGYCPNNPAYHEHTRRVVRAMSEHYAGHPSVIGWQIDNEFGDRCYCSLCAAAFQGWLQRRYGSLDELNNRWGTAFWSHVYTCWREIQLPLETGGTPNPGLALDFYRFCSDSYVNYQQIQIDILRQSCPEHFVTHNFMGFQYDQLDYFDMAASLDFVSWDNYPCMQWNMHEPGDPALPALGHDTMRGLKRRPFWVMEQQAGPAGWELVPPAPRPGQLRLWAYQAIAHGADGVLFFRWRTANAGTEQYWHGLLGHDGSPSGRYREIAEMGAELVDMGDRLRGTQVSARVGMLLSYDSRFAFQIQQNNLGFGYTSHFAEIYRALHRLRVPVDVVAPDADLSRYSLIIAPALHVVDEGTAANLGAYVSGGGVLVVTPRSGVKDEANRVVAQPLPGRLAELCGVEVEEYDSLPPGKGNALRFIMPGVPDTDLLPTSTWSDVLRPTGAEVVAVYEHDYYMGRPAITLHGYGQGRVMYIGALGGQELFLPLSRWALELAGVCPGFQAGEGVEIIERHGENNIMFILNHSEEEQTIEMDGQYEDLLGGPPLEGTVKFGPYDVRVLTRNER